ncbi:MAG: flagellar biosynthetic protein FliO, partial [Pseudomonas sp.]|nr:flagellar biosynthetic protein FliO [Pseudomonas sp.]
MARLLALLLALPGFALAAEPADKAATPMAGSDVAGQLGQLLLGLLLVIGLIFVLAWLLRRVQQLAPRSGQVIKLLATQPLGPRDRLVLVQVGNEQILLGLSAGRIAPLHVLKEPVHL